MLADTIELLAPKAGESYLDLTAGYGGHSRAVIDRTGAPERATLVDRDQNAINELGSFKAAGARLIHDDFAHAAEELVANNERFDMVLLDVGVSSPQFDRGSRGFSFQSDGPLDMRMDQSRGQTGAEFLAATSEQQLRGVIKDYGEERFAKQIARAIIAQRASGQPIATTGQLAKIVASAVPKAEPGQDPATRTFQALRIFLNQELEELSLVLPQCLAALAPEGRLAVISFHSLEDRIVKRFIRGEQDRDGLPSNFPVRAKDLPQPRLVAVGRAIRPSAAEIQRNPRSRSAVLRVAERTLVA